MEKWKPKVLCISGSPRGEKSNSEKILRQLIGHVREFGGTPTLIRLADWPILQCEGCYSRTKGGEKCVFPCIHENMDQTMTVLQAIIEADALCIATPVYWGTSSALVHRVIEKMTSIENNSDEIETKNLKEPLLGKPFALLCSQDAEGGSMAMSQLSWALSQMGMLLIPWGQIFKPSLLNSAVVRTGLKMMRRRKFEWIDNTIRLAARNLVLLPQKLNDYSFDDYSVDEPRC